ncbi:hypothetical protein N7528_005748 [Penicillium herquei]|nr:hypothetical protein N7528_005748 [Penicillium herquei]
MNPSTMTPSILTRPPLDHHLRGNYPLELESNPAWPQIRSCIRAAYPFVFSSVCLPGSTAHAMTIPGLEPPPGSQAVTDPEYNHSPFDLAFYAFEDSPNVHHSIPTTPAHLAVLILTPECLEEANTMMTYRKIQNFLGVNDHEKKIIYFLAGNNEDESFRPGNLVAINML